MPPRQANVATPNVLCARSDIDLPLAKHTRGGYRRETPFALRAEAWAAGAERRWLTLVQLIAGDRRDERASVGSNASSRCPREVECSWIVSAPRQYPDGVRTPCSERRDECVSVDSGR